MTSCHFWWSIRFDRRVAGDPGIVDQHVDRTEVGLDLAHALLAGVIVGHVPFVGLDAGAVAELARALVIAGVIGGNLHAHVSRARC